MPDDRVRETMPSEQSFDEEALDGAYQRGLKLEKSGDFEGAAESYRLCLSMDPADHCGAGLRLAAMGLAETPVSAGDAYVATLFDQHADAFEDILVAQLGYRIPELIAERLRVLVPEGDFGRVLDLGCGTGLVAEALNGQARTMIGVDLSEGMVEVAFDKQLYDDLYVGEAVGFLEDFEEDESFDLIVAADVLPYVGELGPFLTGCAARLAEGGRLAASTECPEGFEGVSVARSHRFIHGEAYVKERLRAHGFEVEHWEAVVVRSEEGRPAPGHLFIARRA